MTPDSEADKAFLRFKPIVLEYVRKLQCGETADLTTGAADTAEFRRVFFEVLAIFARHDLNYLGLIQSSYLRYLIRKGYIAELNLDAHPYTTPAFRSMYLVATLTNFYEDIADEPMKDMFGTAYDRAEFIEYLATAVIRLARGPDFKTVEHCQVLAVILFIQYLKLSARRAERNPEEYPFSTVEFRAVYSFVIESACKRNNYDVEKRQELLADESYAIFLREFLWMGSELTLPDIWAGRNSGWPDRRG